MSIKHTIFSYQTSRKLLQIVLSILVLLPIGFGITGTFLGLRGFSWIFGLPIDTIEPNLDSDFRFLAAVFFGIGMIIAWIIPHIEKQTAIFRIVTGAIFLGGIGRLISVFTVGYPTMLTWILIVIELVAPLFMWWQWTIAKTAKQNSYDTQTNNSRTT